MASSYPPPPTGWEFVFDIDGTIVRRNSLTAYDAPTVKLINDYTPATAIFTTGDYTTTNVSWLFPQLRTVTGYSLAYSSTHDSGLYTSNDSTDGVNGTWTSVKTHAELAMYRGVTTEALRTPTIVNYSSVKAVKLYMYTSNGGSSAFYGAHLWGTYTTNSLQMWHPTLDQPLIANDCDHGDMLRGAISSKDFRIKNLTSQTANDIVVSLQTPELNGALGGSDLIYSSSRADSHNIGNLAPNAISGIITMERTMGVAQTYGSKGTVRVTAVATSWT